MTSSLLKFARYTVAATMLAALVSPALAEEVEEQPTITEETVLGPRSHEAKGDRTGEHVKDGKRGNRKARGERTGKRDGSRRDGRRRQN